MLIEKLNLTYSWLESLISKIDEKDMIESIVSGERNAKDILAHITAWNWNGIRWIESIARGEKPILPMEGHTIDERPRIFAELNEEIHKVNLGKSAKEVIDEHYESWQALMNVIESLTQDDLDRTFQFDWVPSPTQGWHIVAWRIAHADNHGKQIELWINQWA